MSGNFEIVEPGKHAELKISTERGEVSGDNMMLAPVLLSEVRQLVTQFPILLRKEQETGAFFLCALFGFRKNENLYLWEGSWQEAILPVSILREPFLIADTKASDQDGLLVAVNLDHPRSRSGAGERIFTSEGDPTHFFEQIIAYLRQMNDDRPHLLNFTRALERHEFIMPISLEAEGLDLSGFNGFYALDEEKLKKAEAGTLAAFHQEGWLEVIFMIIASLGNLTGLIRLFSKKALSR